MRVLLLTLIVFMLAGVSIALTQFDIRGWAVSSISATQPKLAFEPESAPREHSGTIAVARARPQGVMLLSEANRSQAARYVLPQDAGIISGVLNLNAAVQISDGQHAVLRVLVGRQTRGEIVLRPGFQSVSTEIGLTSDDLANETLAIRYALSIEDTTGTCTNDTSFASVVEIEQNSFLTLEVENEDLSSEDLVRVAGNEVLIGWPAWLSEEQKRQRWTDALTIAQRGYEVRFVDAPDSETLSGNKLLELTESVSTPTILREEDPVWPNYFAMTGPNAGKQTFHESKTWKHWYRVGKHGFDTAPTSLNYELLLGPLPSNANWMIVATHNGRILDTQITESGVLLVSNSISLAGEQIEQSNLVEIEVSSTYEPVGLCNLGPELFAELREGSHLVGGGAAFEDQTEAVQESLRRTDPLTLSLPVDLSLVEAQRMLDLVRAVLPEGVLPEYVSTNATITPVRSRNTDVFARDVIDDTQLVWFDEDDLVRAAGKAAVVNDEDVDPSGAIVLFVQARETIQSTALSKQ